MEKVIGAVGMWIILVLVLGALVAWPVQLLWNGSLRDAFAAGAVMEITFWQAWGLTILSGLLFSRSSSSN